MHRFLMRFMALLMIVSVPGVTSAEPPYAMHVGGVNQKIGRVECAQKAMAVLAKDGFLFADRDKNGNVFGFNKKTSVLVVTFRELEQTRVIVITVGRENAEAERVRDLLRTQMLESPDKAEGPSAIGTSEVKHPDGVPHLRCHWETRNVVPVLRFFEPAAALLFEKQGMGTNIVGKGLVFGGKDGQGVCAILAPGPNGISANCLVVAARSNPKDAQELARSLCDALAKILYE